MTKEHWRWGLPACGTVRPIKVRDIVAVEEPLEIQLRFMEAGSWREQSISITMRTPGDDEKLAAGFLFAEGIVRSGNEIDKTGHWGPLTPEGYRNNHQGAATGRRRGRYRVADAEFLHHVELRGPAARARWRHWLYKASIRSVMGRSSRRDILMMPLTRCVSARACSPKPAAYMPRP